MELRELRYLVALADEGTFTRAAARCYVSQQALSKAIATLERRTGTVLVDRRPGASTLTAHGARLAAAGRSLLDEADALVAALQRPAAPSGGVLRVGLLLDGLGSRTAPVLRAFRAAEPDIRIAVTRVQPHEVSDLLLGDAVDVALVHGPVQDERLTSVPLFTEPRLVVVSAADPRADADTLDVDDVLALPARPRRDGIDPGWEGFFTLTPERQGEPERRGQPTGSLEELLWGIALDELFLTVPDHLASTFPGQTYGVAYVPAPGLPPVTFSAVHRADDDRGAVRTFVALVAATTAGLHVM